MRGLAEPSGPGVASVIWNIKSTFYERLSLNNTFVRLQISPFLFCSFRAVFSLSFLFCRNERILFGRVARLLAEGGTFGFFFFFSRPRREKCSLGFVVRDIRYGSEVRYERSSYFRAGMTGFLSPWGEFPALDGELEKFMSPFSFFPLRRVAIFFRQVFRGVEYCSWVKGVCWIFSRRKLRLYDERLCKLANYGYVFLRTG